MNANEIADGLAQMYIEKDVNGLFNKRIQNMLRQQQAEIEALKAIVNGNKEVMADWKAEVKSVRENNTLCWRSQRQQKEQIEALKTELHKYKPQIWEVMKEANK
jgi:glycyl-tRNA synthetase beta subunit